MEKNSLHKRKFSARGVVAFLVFWLLIGSLLLVFQTCTSAIEPMPTAPSDTYGTLLDAHFMTDTDVQYVVGVFNSQFQYGGFDSLVPVLMYRNGSQLRLCFTNGSAPYDSDVFYTYDGAGQLNLSTTSYSQSIRYLMTEYGFKGYVTGTIPSSIAYEEVLFYRDSSGNFINNSLNFATVTGGDGKAVALTAYNRWFQWLSQSSSGGDDGSLVVVNELDIGSIIASLPQAARNILDSTFGFELFGINIAATLTAVLLVSIVAFVVKWLMSR